MLPFEIWLIIIQEIYGQKCKTLFNLRLINIFLCQIVEYFSKIKLKSLKTIYHFTVHEIPNNFSLKHKNFLRFQSSSYFTVQRNISYRLIKYENIKLIINERFKEDDLLINSSNPIENLSIEKFGEKQNFTGSRLLTLKIKNQIKIKNFHFKDTVYFPNKKIKFVNCSFELGVFVKLENNIFKNCEIFECLTFICDDKPEENYLKFLEFIKQNTLINDNKQIVKFDNDKFRKLFLRTLNKTNDGIRYLSSDYINNFKFRIG